MRNIKLTIEYDGTNLSGWQVQNNGERTVQGFIEAALKKILKKKIKLIGSGRTDSGVHARGQVANFKTQSEKSAEEIQNALNANIPDDIAILKVEDASPKFHAQYSAQSKIYRYSILNRQMRSAHQRKSSLLYLSKLNLRLMQKESKILLGRHDFKSFQASDPLRKDKSTVRTIKRIQIRKRGDIIEIDVEADGFLYKMVRNIVGTLLKIGTGKLPKGSMSAILSKKDRNFAGETAKAIGLSLVEVKY